MIELYGFLFEGCWHKWKPYQMATITDKSKNKKTIILSRHIYKCVKCCRFKNRIMT